MSILLTAARTLHGWPATVPWNRSAVAADLAARAVVQSAGASRMTLALAVLLIVILLAMKSAVRPLITLLVELLRAVAAIAAVLLIMVIVVVAAVALLVHP
jgi:hypothetical protein